jgi:hypothetical protein
MQKSNTFNVVACFPIKNVFSKGYNLNIFRLPWLAILLLKKTVDSKIILRSVFFLNTVRNNGRKIKPLKKNRGVSY